MYVCNCNGLTERQVRAAVEAGARKWTEVYAHHGCRPQCGRCVADVAAYLAPPQASPILGPVGPVVPAEG